MPHANGMSNKVKGVTKRINLVAHLVMIEPVIITLSQTACSSQDVDFSNAEALQAYRRQEQSMGAEVRDSAGIAVGVSDLVGERGILMGAIQGAFAAQYQVLRENGHTPSEAFNETVEEATQSLYPLIGKVEPLQAALDSYADTLEKKHHDMMLHLYLKPNTR